ncbi:MAG: 30S ribosomal protein S6 [Endozoicomonadaceae bacterium]|nr:30S ribosomal protein S6 [Endozoicomonadaceae bacterium]
MRHYEVVFLVHADQSDQVPVMLERYKKLITDTKGKLHRLEDWGRRALAYPIKKIHKAHYVMLNIECTYDMLKELQHSFMFNDAILRYMIVSKQEAITTPSLILSQDNERAPASNNRAEHSNKFDEEVLSKHES